MNESTQLAGDLFIKLYERYSRFENRKFLCEAIETLTIIEVKTIIVIGRGTEKGTRGSGEGHIKMSEIAHQLGVTSGTPTVTIDRLIKKGYVDRVRDEEDRRQVFVKLTEKGLESYDEIVKMKNMILQKIFGIIDESQLTTLIAILTKIETDFDMVFKDILEGNHESLV